MGAHRFSTGRWDSGELTFSLAVAALLLFTRGWKVTCSGYLHRKTPVSALKP